MKKIISILLLSIFIYNTFGFLAIHPILSAYYKYLGMQRVEKPSEDELIEKLIFNKTDIVNGIINFKWIHSREFKYNGDMYDIIKKKETDDQLIVYCINDTKEKKLEEEFERKVHNNTNEDKHRPTINVLKFVSVSEPAQYYRHINNPAGESTFNLLQDEFYQSFNLEIPSPPPRLI